MILRPEKFGKGTLSPVSFYLFSEISTIHNIWCQINSQESMHKRMLY
jgi:hypothetical protein